MNMTNSFTEYEDITHIVLC